jgi:competence protein ComEC
LLAQTAERRKRLWQSLRRSLANRLPAKVLFGALATVALLLWLAVATLPDGRLHVTMLDVGEGEAALIETPSGQYILVDGGPSPTQIVTHLGRHLPFWDRTIDLVVLTHPDNAHLNGLIPVLERYDVQQVLHSPQVCLAAACARWQELLREKGIITRQPLSGTTIDAQGGILLTVIHPSTADLDLEEAPLVLRLDYGQSSFLFAGSATRQAETAMLARREPLQCDVLQVAQQGDESATTFPFLQGASPSLAVVSCGRGNRAGHPDEATTLRLARQGTTVLRTDEVGSVEIISDGTSFEVEVGR